VGRKERRMTQPTVEERPRVENAPAWERAKALVEISRISNLRLRDLVEEPVEEADAAGRN
jgi:2-oxo-4-hydroxy-4-carboxy--5-ureidoimidazoline (OHCU) decarboxylase